jgi:nickel-dependent lactate racemase
MDQHKLNRVELISGAWFGDRTIILDFPSNWNVTVMGGEAIPPLTYDQLKEKINNPAGTPRLSVIGQKRTRAAIIIDDITRPTPTHVILPFILTELEKAGFDKESIIIIIASGTHRQASKEDIQKKIGDEIASQIKIICHDCRNDLVYLGESSNRTPIYVNKAVMDCDLKIGVGCIYPHPAAGFSGGSKIIMPGIVGIETARYMHEYMGGAYKRGGSLDTELRREIEDVAARVGLDFIINVVLNQKREIAGLFAGDKILAHRQGVEFASATYSVVPMDNADIIISDMYPFDTSLQFVHDRGFWPLMDSNKNSLKIAIAECPMGLGVHGLTTLSTSIWSRLAHRIKNFKLRYLSHIISRINNFMKYLKLRRLDFIIISNGITTKDLERIFSHSKLFCTWDAFLGEFDSRQKNLPLKIVIYKCSPFLLPVHRCEEK